MSFFTLEGSATGGSTSMESAIAITRQNDLERKSRARPLVRMSAGKLLEWNRDRDRTEQDLPEPLQSSTGLQSGHPSQNWNRCTHKRFVD